MSPLPTKAPRNATPDELQSLESRANKAQLCALFAVTAKGRVKALRRAAVYYSAMAECFPHGSEGYYQRINKASLMLRSADDAEQRGLEAHL